ncbi:Gst Glutathione S-transferase [Burkholderiaceae bacterium]
MSITLYFAPGACSFVPHCMLEASGAAFEPMLVKLHKGEQYEAAYKAINPRSQVPVLVDEGQAVSQVVAICMYLDSKFPQMGFLPAAGMARAKALETFVWMNNTVHTTFMHVFLPNKFSASVDVQADIKAFAVETYRGLLVELQTLVTDAQARGDAWLAGAQFGPLDAYALTLTRWGSMSGINPEGYSALWAFVQQVAAHPPVQRVMERERLQLNLFKA